MSKTKLKKELASLSDEQLVELILSAYDSSKEAKGFFEFFLNPDAEGMLGKKMEIIEKEARRSKWGYSKARISNIKAEIKSFEGLGVGAEYSGKLRYFAIRSLIYFEKFLRYTDALVASVDRLTADYLDYMARNNMLLTAVENLTTGIVENPEAGTAKFRRHLGNTVESTLKELRSKLGLTI